MSRYHEKNNENEAEDSTTSSVLDKEKRIKKEITRLKKIFKDLDEDRKALAENLIKDAAFLSVTMEDLQESINIHGTMTEYKNGENQYGWKPNPDSQSYISYSQKHTQCTKLLNDLLPKSTNIKVDAVDDMDLRGFIGRK